ncbi:GmrSD restriction endonuclease domain-containing protein [Corynebacterium sp. TAE3-ERU16]|uniref:GmrSD restriction endonuclease domain-containing protein n=1 Tax=Corynebacterium sp. TAE3-ERU16 TaxID=2849493 RepID=UPI001C466DCD|nr:DUF262 domain-containing protein [Corynebacterium sp. TAE3-ERU16]MBV7292892.1 DUF262 domain-containing protein [Corynebacterium sp. TAE3-ERU16]
MGFTTPSYDLTDLFARIDRGDIQLPDFQRDYSWNVDRIRSLIVTVLRGYPIGCLMALDTRNEPMRFRPRPLAGAPDTGRNPGMLILDGQQRLTTLYHCLRGDGLVDTVDFRNKRIRRRFYVDVDKAVSEDIMPDEAVLSIDADGEIKSHYGPKIPGGIPDRETARAHGLVPVSALLEDEGTDMLFDFVEGADAVTRERVKRFNNTVAKPLVRYSVPIIRLDRETAQGGVGSIFSQANSAGLQMDVVDLLTAVFASEDPDFRLSDSWREIEEALREHPVLDGVDRTAFFTAVTLLTTAGKGHASGHREDILRLTLADYAPAAQRTVDAFISAAEFLEARCISDTTRIPYAAQITPLAVILSLLGETPEVFRCSAAVDRLNRWFWSGVFGELYGSASVVVRTGRDVNQVTPWVRAALDGESEVPEPASISDARFVESRLLSVGPESGVWKGTHALLMGRGARDWRTGDRFDAQNLVEDEEGFHPIFPPRYCRRTGVNQMLADSVLNRSPLSRRTEMVMDGAEPARYLARVQSKSLMDDDEFDAVLASHLLDPRVLRNACSDDFFADRRTRLLKMIEEAMGKGAIHDVDEANLGGGEEGPDAFATTGNAAAADDGAADCGDGEGAAHPGESGESDTSRDEDPQVADS